jgi:hypothetical protein
MLAAINNWIATALLVFGLCVVGFGLLFGFFGWLNDGFVVGLKIFLIAAAFGGALLAGAFGFRWAGRAHTLGDAQRWWIQLSALGIASFASLLAAYVTSLIDRVFPR